MDFRMLANRVDDRIKRGMLSCNPLETFCNYFCWESLSQIEISWHSVWHIIVYHGSCLFMQGIHLQGNSPMVRKHCSQGTPHIGSDMVNFSVNYCPFTVSAGKLAYAAIQPIVWFAFAIDSFTPLPPLGSSSGPITPREVVFSGKQRDLKRCRRWKQ